MKIRKANQEDYQAIYDLVKIAFSSAKVTDGKEQDFVIKLRQGKTYLPELEFVAEGQTGLIGHIRMTKQVIKTKDGDYLGLLVAPLCVKLENRGVGIGGKLLEYARLEAIKQGYQAAFLVGDPNYYSRYGYRHLSNFKITNLSGIPDEYVLACQLVSDALINVEGTLEIEE